MLLMSVLPVLHKKLTPRYLTLHIVTRWSGSGGIKAYSSGQLASLSVFTLLVGSFACKRVPQMTYKVSSGMLSLYTLTHTLHHCPITGKHKVF